MKAITKMTMRNWKQAMAVIISDYSHYNENTCCNGGGYGFDSIFTKCPNRNVWKCKEETTAEFCPYCYQWDCLGTCDQAVMAEKTAYSEKDMLHQIQSAQKAGWDIYLVDDQGHIHSSSSEEEEECICSRY